MKKHFFFLSLVIAFTLGVGQMWGGDYAKTAANSVKTGDVVIITYDNGTLYAMSNDKGTSNPPSAVAVTATNDVISTEATNILWDVTVADGSYTFKPHGDADNALYCTSTNNGVRVGTNSNNAFTVDGTSKYLVNTATSRYVGCYNSQDFRCYTSINANIKDQTPAFYVLQEGGDEPGGDEPGGDEPGGDDPTPTSGEWIKVEPGDLATNDVVVIVENDSKAMSNDKGTSAAPTAVAVTVSEDKLSEAPADNIKWTVTVSDGSYVFATGNNHLYCTNTNNGVRVGTNANSAFTISNEGYLYNTATSRYVGVYNNADWRCYGSINSNISGQTFSFFKESDGSAVKPAAGLAYAEADQKKLTKLGEAFTAPTLANPNNLTGIAYASSADAVAEVNASTGAVTIKTAGVAVITASFAGNDDYKAGSASYTIGVTTHAGTSADPYDVADARNVIDAFGTKEGVYMSGKVSQITTAYDETYHNISFDISTDGTTAADQVRAYRCKGLNNTDFTSADDVKTSATVTVYGNLTKYNSTYELDAGCYLTAYEAPAVPKTPIANTQETAYTVAQALAYAADGETYDLDDYVYIQGVVYDVKSFNNGAMNIYIKDANADNKFELFKCAGINDGSSTTGFEGLSDVQVGNIVIGYGQMMYFKDGDIYEFKQGNYLVDLQVPVTGVELAETAEVAVGSTVTLTATILPSNATGTIVWSVTSGSDKASVAGGVVSGVAEGEAVIRATVQGTEIYAECTVTVTAAAAPLTDYYEKVTTTAGITDGTYLIVYEEGSLAFNGGLENLDASSNTISVTIVGGNKIGVTTATEAATFFIDVTAGSILAANGKYIGVTSNSNGLKQSDNADAYANAFAIDASGNAVISAVFENANMTMRYNKGSGQERFRYYGSGQQPIALYKLANEVVKANPELAWSAESVVISVGDAWSAPSLGYANGFDGLAAVTYASNNESVATVTDAGVISLAGGTGTAIVTATFAGNNNYREGSASYTITVNEVGDNLSGTWALVTDAAQLEAGKKVVIAYYGLSGNNIVVKTMGAQNANNRAAVTSSIESANGVTILAPGSGTKVFTLMDAGDGKFAFQALNGNYLYAASNSSNHLKETNDNTNVNTIWTITIDENCVATIKAQNDEAVSHNWMRYNDGSNVFSCYASGQKDIALFMLQENDEPDTPEPIEPELNYEEVRTGLEVGRHYTICMPKKIIAVRGATFWGINNGDETAVYMELQQPPFEAGTPFIFYATATTLKVAYEGEETATPIENGALRGTLSYMDHAALTAAGSQVYLMYNNALHPLGTNNHLDANRAYLLFEELQAGAPAPGRQVKRMPLQTDVTTGVEDAETSTQPKKILIDGQLFIRCGEKLYNATGSMVK